LPWFELDCIIISAMHWPWEPTRYVVTSAMLECTNRKVAVSEDEVFARVLELVRLGSLSVTGDIWQWRTQFSWLGLAV
jgi:hypothetical protein